MPFALPLLLALFLTAGLLLDPNSASAEGPTSLGLDLASDGNTGTFVGDVQNCLNVDLGDFFPLDVFVKNAHSVRAWELRFAFDNQLLRIVDHDFEHFLLSTAPSGSIFPSLFEVERSNRYFLAAAEFRGTPDSGSGVLVRLTMEAIAPGRSPVIVVTEPSFLAPRLTDANGDAPFEGPVSQGEVAVGEPCTPGDTTSDGGDDGGDTTSGGGDDGGDTSSGGDDGGPLSPPSLVSLSDSPPGHPPEGGSGADGEDEVAEPPPEGGSTPEAAAALQSPEASSSEDSAPDQVMGTPPSDGGSSGIPWLWPTILAIAVFGLVGGGALIALNLRSGR